MSFWETRCNGRTEREVRAQTSHSSEDHRASGRPAALFSPRCTEQRNQMWSSVFGNANPSNLSGTLLDGNKDHLLSQARSDQAKRELHVESLNKCIGDLQKTNGGEKQEHYRTCKTNLLNLVENNLDCKRTCYEMGKMKRAQVQQVDKFSLQQLREHRETIQQLTFQVQQMQEQMNSMNSSGEFQDIEPNFSGRLSHVSSQPEMIPSSRALLSRDKRLLFDTWNQSGVQENVFGNQFPTFDSPRDFLHRISSENVHRNREASLGDPKVKTSLASEGGQNHGALPMPMFASRPLTWNSKHPVDIPRNYVVGQQRQQMSELQFDRFPDPSSFWCGKQDSKHRFHVVLIFRRRLCYGSKKWRWWILWMSRYAVVVQDLATQWIQSYPCKTKTSQKTEKNDESKSHFSDKSLEFGKSCEDYPGIIVRQHHTDQKQMGLLKEQCVE